MKKPYAIGRTSAVGFDVYEEHSTALEALAAFRKQISSVSNPEEIECYHGDDRRRDIEDDAWASLRESA